MAKPKGTSNRPEGPISTVRDHLTRMVMAEARNQIATRIRSVLLPDYVNPDNYSKYTLVRSPLSEVEDYREYHPSVRTPRVISGRPATSTVRRSEEKYRDVRYFDNPRHTLICHRRKTRREVLHAFNRTGRGTSRKRLYRRNPNSEVYC